MSTIFGNITGQIGRILGKFFPSWGGPQPEPEPILPEPEPTPPEEEPEEEGESEYDTASNTTVMCSYQDNNIRWYSATRRFMFWRDMNQNKQIEFFDGSTQWISTKEDFRELSRDWFLIQANRDETLQEAYVRYNEEADAISAQSNGQIDLHKTGTYAMASLRFFQDVTSAPIKSIHLSIEEEHWVNSAYTGSMIWAEPFEGFASELDFNNYYPFILANDDAYWPIGPGEFRNFTIEDIKETEFKYGIYHATEEANPITKDYNVQGLFVTILKDTTLIMTCN